MFLASLITKRRTSRVGGSSFLYKRMILKIGTYQTKNYPMGQKNVYPALCNAHEKQNFSSPMEGSSFSILRKTMGVIPVCFLNCLAK